MIRRPPRSTLFPSPTLFRFRRPRARPPPYAPRNSLRPLPPPSPRCAWSRISVPCSDSHRIRASLATAHRRLDYQRRSEEHTSELQSRQYLVCRLLLEKKKTP